MYVHALPRLRARPMPGIRSGNAVFEFILSYGGQAFLIGLAAVVIAGVFVAINRSGFEQEISAIVEGVRTTHRTQREYTGLRGEVLLAMVPESSKDVDGNEVLLDGDIRVSAHDGVAAFAGMGAGDRRRFVLEFTLPDGDDEERCSDVIAAGATIRGFQGFFVRVSEGWNTPTPYTMDVSDLATPATDGRTVDGPANDAATVGQGGADCAAVDPTGATGHQVLLAFN